MDQVPDDVLGEIFLNLSLKERCIAAQVCNQWHGVLSRGYFGLDNVMVVNLFESNVLANNLRNGPSSRVNCVPLKEMSQLSSALTHVTNTSSVKFWFKDPRFVTSALAQRFAALLTESNMRVKCVDLYPYGHFVPLTECVLALPHVNAVTLRPHGTDFFWNGLTLREEDMPQAEHLDTFVLDSINLTENTAIPTNVTTLEWSNRSAASFVQLRSHLLSLHKLEYLSLSHIEFKTHEHLYDFFDVISTKNMPNLHYVVFRFVHFPDKSPKYPEHADSDALSALKVIKLDLCYGALDAIVHQFLAVTNQQLKIVTINCIYEDLDIQQFYKVIPQLDRRQISVQFGVLQKMQHPLTARQADVEVAVDLDAAEVAAGELNNNINNNNNGNGEANPPEAAPASNVVPNEILRALWKIDMSFCDNRALLTQLLSPVANGPFVLMAELKFIQCANVTDKHLELAAKNCPRLRKLSIVKCENVSDAGIRAFLAEFQLSLEDTPQSVKRAPHVQIMWKCKQHPAAFYLALLNDRNTLLKGLRSRFHTKSLPGSGASQSLAERLVFWPMTHTNALNQRTLSIQNYNESELYAVYGFAIDWPLGAEGVVEEGRQAANGGGEVKEVEGEVVNEE